MQKKPEAADGPTFRATPIDSFVGMRIKLRRDSLDITPAELARVLGISEDTQRGFEDGTCPISAAMLLRIANHLETPMLWFYDGATVELQASNDPEQQSQSAHDATISKEGLELLTFYYQNLDQPHKSVLIDLGRILTQRLTDPT